MKITTAKGSDSAEKKAPQVESVHMRCTDNGGCILTVQFKPPKGKGFMPGIPSEEHAHPTIEHAVAHAHRALGGKGSVHSSARHKDAKHPPMKYAYDSHGEMVEHMGKMYGKKK